MKKYETRNTKYETNLRAKFLNVQNDKSLGHLNFSNLNLFRISKLGIRIFVFFLSLLTFCGCEENAKITNTPQKTNVFVAKKITFNQLTEFPETWKIVAYIDVYDQFNSRIKTPAVWRFELYSKVPRSADPTGGRVRIWPDIDLTTAAENNSHWQDYLRCYKFELLLETDIPSGDYVLEATCSTDDGKRVSGNIEIRR